MEHTTIKPETIGMLPAIEMTGASNQTFFYRNKHKRIINFQVLNQANWELTPGPFIYAVTDRTNVIRYIGKWEDSTPLKSRWIRHNEIHHQESSRNHYLRELDQGFGPLRVWMIQVETIKNRLGLDHVQTNVKELAAVIESQLIEQLKPQLSWNKTTPARKYSVALDRVLTG